MLLPVAAAFDDGVAGKEKNKTKRNSGLFRPLVQHEHGVNPTLAREIEIKT